MLKPYSYHGFALRYERIHRILIQLLFNKLEDQTDVEF